MAYRELCLCFSLLFVTTVLAENDQASRPVQNDRVKKAVIIPPPPGVAASAYGGYNYGSAYGHPYAGQLQYYRTAAQGGGVYPAAAVAGWYGSYYDDGKYHPAVGGYDDGKYYPGKYDDGKYYAGKYDRPPYYRPLHNAYNKWYPYAYPYYNNYYNHNKYYNQYPYAYVY